MTEQTSAEVSGFLPALKQRREFVSALGILGVLALLYIILGNIMWGANPSITLTNFCEKVGTGIIKEPMNTFSNLAYVLVGLVILWQLPSLQKEGDNPMNSRGVFPVIYAAGSIYIGVGSFAMHGTNTNWGANMDWSGMLFFISFPIYYNLSRNYSWTDRKFIKVFASIFIVTALLDVLSSSTNIILIKDYSGTDDLTLSGIIRDYLWSFYIGIWIIQEVKNLTNNNLLWMVAMPIIACIGLSTTAPTIQIVVLSIIFALIAYVLNYYQGTLISRSHYPYLWIGVGSYVLGNVVWRYGRNGMDACIPEAMFQYHALWHLLTAVSVYAFYRYFVSEKAQFQD